MADENKEPVKHEDEHEPTHYDEGTPFRILWIILAVILGAAILWILFSYIYLAVTRTNSPTPNNNNQNQQENPGNPSTPPSTTPTPQTQ